LEIHRVEFRDARKVTFNSDNEKEVGAPEIFEIDHANCTGGTLCDIDSCNSSGCTTLTQVLDPEKSKPSNLCPRSGLCLGVRGESEEMDSEEDDSEETDSEDTDSGSLGLIAYSNFSLLSIRTAMFVAIFIFFG